MGETPTGSGYTYVLDDNPPKPIAFNTTIQLRGLSAGVHTVELTNCLRHAVSPARTR
jgi:hypothetical protein